MMERMQWSMTCKQVGPREVETTLSSRRTDRMKDSIEQNWRLEAYRRNPVIFWNHQTHDLPIARSTWIGVVDGQLRSRDEFPPLGMHPFADRVHDLVVSGFINAKSVGFMPIKRLYNESRGGWDYLESELLEHSYVGLPANVDAVIDGRAAPDVAAVRKWFGATLWADEIIIDLDLVEDDTIDLDRQDLVEAIRTVVPALVTAEVDRRRGGEVLDLDGLDDFDPLASAVDRALLIDTMRTAIPALVRSTLNQLRGRIDD